MSQFTLEQFFALAVQHHQAGQLPQAEHLYRQVLTQQPNHAESLHYLGLIAGQRGQDVLAASLIRQAIVLKPNSPDAFNNLGITLRSMGQLDEAIAAFRQAIALRPDYSQAQENLADALKTKAQPGIALGACRQAVALNPDRAEAHNILGGALQANGQLDEAIVAYRQATALKPDFPEAHNNLAIALAGNGQLDEAIASFRQAIALKPGYSDAHSGLVLALHYHPGYDAQTITEELRRWNHQHADPLKQHILPHSNDRNPNRRLRIGYVSPDLRGHVVGLFLLTLLAHHDKSRFEVFAYAEVPVPDIMTQCLRGYIDGWRNTVGLSDVEVGNLIRQDRIDILVDLAGHTARSRLLVFARKPAPIQVAWLGYPGSTGLETIDYRLTDPYLEPPGHNDQYSSEEPFHLPNTFCCYQARPGGSEVGPAPVLTAGRFMFACLNNPTKVTEPTLMTWAQVLRAVPASDLILYAQEGTIRQRLRDRLAGQGIDPRRIDFVGHGGPNYLEFFRRIDLCLDPFPYNGCTTTCDALWMGVPVVSLAGQTICSRMGVSALSNVGLPELVANSTEEYVRIAKDLANHPLHLNYLRSSLRQRMEKSPLMDAPRFARDIEAAFREMWRKWCATVPANA